MIGTGRKSDTVWHYCVQLHRKAPAQAPPPQFWRHLSIATKVFDGVRKGTQKWWNSVKTGRLCRPMEPCAAWVGVTGANPFSCLKIEAVQKFTVVHIDIYLRCSKPPQTLNPGADNSCLFLLQILFSAVSMFLSQMFHPWGSGQAPRKCVRAPAANGGGSQDALLATLIGAVLNHSRVISWLRHPWWLISPRCTKSFEGEFTIICINWFCLMKDPAVDLHFQNGLLLPLLKCKCVFNPDFR